MNRRDFIRMSSLASASLFVPNFLKAFDKITPRGKDEKILIVLQLTGGNDGLNTIIPVKNDLYFKYRQQIAIKNPLALNKESGIHPALTFFKTLYDNGELAIMNNVGYPDPNRSHFRSMDIWQSASKSTEYLNTGWLGRYLDHVCGDCNNPIQALEINNMLSLALKGERNKALSFINPNSLKNNVNENYFKDLAASHDHKEEMAAYLYQTLGSTIQNADYLVEKFDSKSTTQSYPDTKLGKNFKTISSLIKSDINTRVYYVEMTGFDTHVNQLNRQEKQFNEINEAITSFVTDMKKSRLFDKVLLMTFSEFGRRVSQNASKGTDHGTANQMFFISGGLKKKGHLNALPNLQNLQNGDLIFTEDFRKVYATVLNNWLNVKTNNIIDWDKGFYNFI